MSTSITITIIAAIVIAAIVITWVLSAKRMKAGFLQDIHRREDDLRFVSDQLSESRSELAGKVGELSRVSATLTEREADLIRKEAEVQTAEQLRASEKEQHAKALEEIKASNEKAIAELKAGQEKAIEAARHPNGTRAKGLRQMSPDKIHIAEDRNRFGDAYEQSSRMRRIRRYIKHAARNAAKSGLQRLQSELGEEMAEDVRAEDERED